MSQASRRRGTAFEREVAEYLAQFWPYAERAPRWGARDKGDIAGTPLVWEAKAAKTIDLAGFVDELVAEVANAGTDYGFCVVKRRRRPIDEAYAVAPLGMVVRLLREAGW